MDQAVEQSSGMNLVLSYIVGSLENQRTGSHKNLAALLGDQYRIICVKHQL